MVADHPGPRPDSLTWCCAGLVAIPACLILLATLHTIATWPPWVAGPAGIGMFFGSPFSIFLLRIEYLAVVRRQPRAALHMSFLLGYFILLGSIPVIVWLLEALHIKAPDRRSMGAMEFTIDFAFWLTAIVVCLGHLRWYRRLTRAWQRLTPSGTQ